MVFALSQLVPAGIRKFSQGQEVAWNRVELYLVMLELRLPHKKSNPHRVCIAPYFLKESFTNEFVHLTKNCSAELGTGFYLSSEPTSKAHNLSQSKHIPVWVPADGITASVGMGKVIAWEKNAGLDP